MKTLSKKLISLLLTLTMIFSLSATAFAAENYGNVTTSINTQEDIDAARDAYAVLTPEAKAIFDESLAYDAEMLEFHKTYVDKNFTPPALRPQMRSAAAVADPMRILMAELGALGLPSAVLYSLKAMGASMVAALADGPLPLGDILLAAATASTAIIIAANWDAVSPKFNQIIGAFQKAFSTASSNISSAFAKIKSDVKKEVEKKEKEEKKKEKKEVEDAKKKIPSRLKDKNGNVKIGEFDQPVKKKTAYKEKGGWYIEKDRDGHKGSEWKLKDPEGRRKASLKGNGEVVGT